jgi:hypothetical protein
LNARFFELLPGKLDRTRRKIHTRHPPASPGKGDYVGACAAAKVNGAAGFVILYEIE